MKKKFMQLYRECLITVLKWRFPILVAVVIYKMVQTYPWNYHDFMSTGLLWYEFVFLICAIPFVDSMVQAIYEYLMRQKPGYLERQQKDKEAADKWKADMAAKRAKYGRWWWLKRHKK